MSAIIVPKGPDPNAGSFPFLKRICGIKTETLTAVMMVKKRDIARIELISES